MIYGCDKRAAQHQRIKVWTEGPDLQKPDRLRAGHFLWSSLRAKVAELRRFCRDFQGNATGLLYNPDCVANLRCSALQDLMISSPSCTLMSVRREVCERKRHLTNNKAVSVISIAFAVETRLLVFPLEKEARKLACGVEPMMWRKRLDFVSNGQHATTSSEPRLSNVAKF